MQTDVHGAQGGPVCSSAWCHRFHGQIYHSGIPINALSCRAGSRSARKCRSGTNLVVAAGKTELQLAVRTFSTGLVLSKFQGHGRVCLQAACLRGPVPTVSDSPLERTAGD